LHEEICDQLPIEKKNTEVWENILVWYRLFRDKVRGFVRCGVGFNIRFPAAATAYSLKKRKRHGEND